MAITDYFKGPEYRQRTIELETQLSQLQERYAQLQALAKKYGAMEVAEVQRVIEQETARLASIRQSIGAAEQEAAGVAQRVSELRGQVLVLEETLLLESFALYTPKFKLSTSYEYKTRLDGIRERQKAMIKNGEAATGNMGWEVNGSKAEGRKLVNDMISSSSAHSTMRPTTASTT